MGIMDHLAAAEFERRVQARARVKDMADRVDLLDRLALLRLLEEREDLACRVAELEAQGEPTGTEYGVVWPDGSERVYGMDRCEDRWTAQHHAEHATNGARAVQREVREVRGAWEPIR